MCVSGPETQLASYPTLEHWRTGAVDTQLTDQQHSLGDHPGADVAAGAASAQRSSATSMHAARPQAAPVWKGMPPCCSIADTCSSGGVDVASATETISQGQYRCGSSAAELSKAPFTPALSTAVTHHSTGHCSSNSAAAHTPASPPAAFSFIQLNANAVSAHTSTAPASPASAPAVDDPRYVAIAGAAPAIADGGILLSAAGLLDDSELDGLLLRLSGAAAGNATAGAAVGADIAAERHAVSPANMDISNLTAAAIAAVATAAAAGGKPSTTYQPRWAKHAQAHASSIGATDSSTGYETATSSLVSKASSSYSGSGNRTSKAGVWTASQPTVTVDLRSGGEGAGSPASEAALLGSNTAGNPRPTGSMRTAVTSTAPEAVEHTVTTAVGAIGKHGCACSVHVEDDESESEGGSDDSQEDWMQFRQQHRRQELLQQQLQQRASDHETHLEGTQFTSVLMCQ